MRSRMAFFTCLSSTPVRYGAGSSNPMGSDPTAPLHFSCSSLICYSLLITFNVIITANKKVDGIK